LHSGSGPWSYSITDVPAHNQFNVQAFMDLNGDEALDDAEPEGILGAFDIAASMTGKDVELVGDGSAINPCRGFPCCCFRQTDPNIKKQYL